MASNGKEESSMNRFVVTNLFGISGLNIAWYGVIIASGLMLGILLAALRAKRRGWSPDVVLDFILLAVPLAVIGGALLVIALMAGSAQGPSHEVPTPDGQHQGRCEKFGNRKCLGAGIEQNNGQVFD